MSKRNNIAENDYQGPMLSVQKGFLQQCLQFFGVQVIGIQSQRFCCISVCVLKVAHAIRHQRYMWQ